MNEWMNKRKKCRGINAEH